MFWSLVIQPGKKYTSVVRDSFHLSTAVLDCKSVGKNDGGIFPVQVVVDNQELILCNLSNNCLQMSLDLFFDSGSELTFSTSGKATIHLTGYTTDDFNDSEEEVESDNSAESSEAEETEDLSTNQVKAAKEKKQPISKKNSLKKRKSDVNEAVTAKKAKVTDGESSEDDENSNLDEFDDSDLGDISLSDDDDSEEDVDDDENDTRKEDLEEDSDFSDDSNSDTGINLTKKKNDLPQTPKSNQRTTPGLDKKHNKTPVNKKKDDKLNKSNLQQLTNGVTPKSEKKDKRKVSPKSDVKTPKGNESISGTPQSQKKQTVEGGVIVEELKPGNGPVAKPGKMVAVYYTGRLKSNNRVFDQSNNGPGFKFRLGRGEVIKGWDVALSGMKVGSKRRITCPPAMAYGAKGSPPSIPPNSSLVFDVELKSVN